MYHTPNDYSDADGWKAFDSDNDSERDDMPDDSDWLDDEEDEYEEDDYDYDFED